MPVTKRRSVYLTPAQDEDFLLAQKFLSARVGLRVTQQELLLRLLKYVLSDRMDDFLEVTTEEVRAEIEQLIAAHAGYKKPRRKKRGGPKAETVRSPDHPGGSGAGSGG